MGGGGRAGNLKKRFKNDAPSSILVNFCIIIGPKNENSPSDICLFIRVLYLSPDDVVLNAKVIGDGAWVVL